MAFESMISCLRESELDTIEISLRKRLEVLISEGNIEQAELIEDAIESIDKVLVCEE